MPSILPADCSLRIIWAALFFCLPPVSNLQAQETKAAGPPLCLSYEEDHRLMMSRLGITALRPGRNGNPEALENGANYEEALANPYPDLPPLMKLANGRAVATPEAWWAEKRPQVRDDFEREVYGRIPAQVPGVRWEVVYQEREYLGWTPVLVKKLVGRVDNTAYPMITVELSMVVVTPANAPGPVPLLMLFGPAVPPAPLQPRPDDFETLNQTLLQLLKTDSASAAILDKYPAYRPLVRPEGVSANGFWRAPAAPDRIHHLINAGWGYAFLDPASIQPDNPEGLTCSGIIALTNKGKPREPEQWGALRAWAWGAARGLDYLETDPQVDASRVGIEGVSRYGKAALVTLAFEERFALGLIGSSGKGGTTLHRRNYGEAVENLTGGEYYWMAGNYLKYGAETGSLGSMNASALPVDSHELIALCAPRPLFISYGVPEAGDAHWLDHQGSFMAAVAASPAYELLGVPGLGVSADYREAQMPPVGEGLLRGKLAWRQHAGGHTDAPNMPYFIEWANDQLLPGQE